MQTLSFEKLARELEAAGAAPSVIARITEELKEHCADAEQAALERGLHPAEARRQARENLGSADAIVAAVASHPDLLDWRHRFPQSARCVDSLTWCLATPAAPFVYCASHPAFIVRWGLSSSLAVCVTGSILFAMQWFVLLSSGI
jgi:hypothetical protein